MTDPSKPRPKPPAAGNRFGKTPEELRANFKRCTVTHQEAMLLYLEMKPKPSKRGLFHLLKNQGHKVSEGTIGRWCATHKWTTHIDTHRRVLDSEILGFIKLLNVEGANVTEMAFKGAQARLIAHLGRAINKVECKTPKDVNDLLEACERLRAMCHTIRGDAFEGVRKTGESVLNGQTVGLGTFKPKVVGSNGNGAGHE